MKNKQRSPMKFALIVILMAAALAPAILWERAASAYLTYYPSAEAPPKRDVTLDDNENIKTGASRANVLFVLDAGSAMTFTPAGTMPEWGINATTVAQANDMLRHATYGHGGLPMLPGSVDRLGREGPDPDDAANNMTTGNWNISNHLNDYYAPFDYTNSMAAEDFGIGTAGNRPAIPYALVFKNSAWWQNGPPGAFTRADLVPNDSRMYKMKLVMWRVLSDTVLLENLRIGMATTFQELNGPSTGYIADFYKTNPYGVGSSGSAGYTNGTGPDWATGMPGSYGYGNSVKASWGIDRGHYSLSHASAQWKLLNRAYLRVPIAEYSQEHINQFRLWIDSHENISVTMNDAAHKYYFKNPELFGDGKTYLSTAIYPGHADLPRATLLNTNDLLGKPGIVFSHNTQPTTMSVTTNSEAAWNSGSALGNYFKAGSGEALGTVLDFFSPPVSGIGGVTKDALNVRNAPSVSFPLNDPCDKNWVIIFTAGDDSGDNAFTSAGAVGQLYNFTKNNNLTRFTGKDSSGTNQFANIKLEDGVRTLVVGFVDPDSTAPNVVALRAKLNAMAVAGDPGNADAHAYFANDVAGLLGSLRSILARINSDIQPSKGAMLEGGSIGDETFPGSPDSEVLNFYASDFRINLYDQWEGAFTRYESVMNKKTGEFETKKKWDLGTNLLAARNTTPGSRNLQYWAGGGSGTNFKKLEYTGSAEFNSANANLSAATTRHPLASDASVNLNFTPVGAASAHNTAVAAEAAAVNSVMDTQTAGNDHTFRNKIHPSRAMIDWYYGYEVSYSYLTAGGNREVRHFKRRHMLADTGNSGVTKVGPLDTLNSLPGFQAFAASRQNEAAVPTKLYFQTNDGLLHVVNAASGSEERAILPPPSLLPHRAWSLKTLRVPTDGMFRFADGASITITWKQAIGGGWDSVKSGTWHVGGMTLKEAVNHLNARDANSGDTPSGGVDITFSAVLKPSDKAVLRAVAGDRDFRLSGSGLADVGIPNNAEIPRGTSLAGTTEVAYPRNDRYRWIDVQDFMTLTSDDLPISSIPSFTLDGPVQVRYFDMGTPGDHKWRGYMVATLGRGGGGLYAMDVTDPASPEYLWYHETLEEADGDPNKVRVFHQTNKSVYDKIEPRTQDITRGAGYWPGVIGAPGTAEPDKHPYEQLGYNSPKPGFGVARTTTDKFQNIIALPGGSQNTLNLADNGKMGAALYIIDPDVKYHADPADSANHTPGGVRVFNSASFHSLASKWRVGSPYAEGTPYSDPYMGMMISEPTFLSDHTGNRYISDGIFASDNRGNIHLVSMNNLSATPPEPADMNNWTIRTVGTLRSASDAPTDSYSNPYGVFLGWRTDDPKTMWVGGGTANIGGKYNSYIANKSQMLFSFKMPALAKEHPDDPEPVGLSSRGGDINGPGWTALNRECGGDSINTDAGHDGWYVGLAPEDAEYEEEYATVRPVMFGGIMVSVTFLPEKISASNSDLCDTGKIYGKSRIYPLMVDTGEHRWVKNCDEPKYWEFDGIKITGITQVDDTLIFTYSELDKKAARDSIKQNVEDHKNEGLAEVKGMNALTLKLASSDGGISPVTGNDGIVNYWRFIE